MAKKTIPRNTEKKPKHPKTRSVWTHKKKKKKKKKPTSTSWFKLINDDKHRLVIPVGPRFQADLPEWTGPLNNEAADDTSSKWLGTKIWPTKDSDRIAKDDTAVGQGRPDFCLCPSPGAVECVKRHVLNKRVKLMVALGPAFWRWKFDEMGEEVTKLWNSEEEKEFESIVRMNPNSLGKSFLKPALERLGSQSTKSIVNYYFNVYIPRRMSVLTRSGSMLVDTDDEAVDGETPSPKVSRKKCRPGKITLSSDCKYSKTRYLKGRR